MVVYTVGTFDLLHAGHLALLKYCESLGDVMAVVLPLRAWLILTNPMYRLLSLINEQKC